MHMYTHVLYLCRLGVGMSGLKMPGPIILAEQVSTRVEPNCSLAIYELYRNKSCGVKLNQEDYEYHYNRWSRAMNNASGNLGARLAKSCKMVGVLWSAIGSTACLMYGCLFHTVFQTNQCWLWGIAHPARKEKRCKNIKNFV